jgi:ABC-2 type transport system ATP-binding protein
MTAVAAAIEVEDLRKAYAGRPVVAGVTFRVSAGEVFGLVGPNGAGKTTIAECLFGLRTPDSGRIAVLGLDPGRDGDELRRRVGVQLQDAALPDRLRVAEALRLFASFYRRPDDWERLMRHWGLEEQRRTAFAKLSGGQRRRLFVALALINRPELVVLDELTTGLDPQARRACWAMIRQIRDAGVTVMLVTHDMTEAERLCDTVAIIHKGQIVAMDSPAALVATMPGSGKANLEDVFLHLTGADGEG